MTTETKELGSGVETQIKNGKLLIQVDLGGDFGFSSSGKNVMIATTSGNQAVAHGDDLIKVSVNVYRTPTAAEKSAYLKSLNAG